MPTPASPMTALWHRLPLKRLVGIAAAATLAVAALFGGLSEADHVTPVAFGQTYDNGSVRVTPQHIAVLEELDGFRPLAPECRYLALRATVESSARDVLPIGTAYPAYGEANDCAARTTDAIAGTPVVLAGLPASFAGARRARDSGPTETFEPGFTEDLDLVWMIPAGDRGDNPRLLFPNMAYIVSTLRLAPVWIADADRYGQLELDLPEQQ